MRINWRSGKGRFTSQKSVGFSAKCSTSTKLFTVAHTHRYQNKALSLSLVHNCIVLSLLPVKSTSKAKSNIGYYKKKNNLLACWGKVLWNGKQYLLLTVYRTEQCLYTYSGEENYSYLWTKTFWMRKIHMEKLKRTVWIQKGNLGNF